jgi:hypothetical protein
VSPGWLLLVVTYLLVAPGILLLGPLAGLLLVAWPVSRQAWVTVILAVAWCLLWLAQREALPGQFLRAYSVSVIGAWIILAPRAPGRGLRQAALAIAAASAVTFGWMMALGVRWADVELATARWWSSGFLEQARMADQLWGDAGPQLSAPLFELAGQARTIVQLLPAGLVLVTLAGLALAWRGHFALATPPLGPAPKPLTAFTFSDHAVWLVVISLALLLIPGGTAIPGAEQVASNVLLVMLALYALRGGAVFRAGAGRVGPVGIALYTVLTILMLAFVVSGLTILGLADTWLDFRRRMAPTTGGTQR